MKLTKTQIWWMKYILFISMISLGLLSSPISVVADWEEDFSDISDWTFTQIDDPRDSQNATWEVQEGILVINTPPHDSVEICRPMSDQYGTWSVDLNIPSGSEGLFVLYSEKTDTRWSGVSAKLTPEDRKLLLINTWFDASSGGQTGNDLAKTIDQDLSGWHNLTIKKNGSHIALFVDDFPYLKSSAPDWDKMGPFNEICLQTSDGGGGSIQMFDNLKFGEGSENDIIDLSTDTEIDTGDTDENMPLTPWLPIGLGIAVAVISGSVFTHRFFKKKSLIHEYKLNGNFSRKVNKSISQTFSKRLSLYNILVGLKGTSDRSVDNQIRKLASPEIFKYQFLLQPVRLSIMKVLFKELKLPATEIKRRLNLSWSLYSNYSRGLEKKGYLSTKNEVSEDGVQQMVYLEPLGRNKFERLLELLDEFIENSRKFDDYFHSFSSEDLYPKS